MSSRRGNEDDDDLEVEDGEEEGNGEKLIDTSLLCTIISRQISISDDTTC